MTLKITMLTYGSRGDVEPFAALAGGLIASGDAVTLAGPAKYRDLITSPEVNYLPLPGDPGQLAEDFREKAGANPLKTFSVMSRHVWPIAQQVFNECQKAVQGADLVLHSFAMTDGGHTLASRVGAGSISVQFFPVFSPTGAFPALMFPDLPLGSSYRRLTHWASTRLFHWGGRVLYRVLRRRSRTLPPLEEWPFQSGSEEAVPILYAFSPQVVPKPADWDDRSVVTGYWFREPGEAWEPPDAVRAFLRRPRRKVYIGLGSMLPDSDRELMGMFVNTLESLGLAGIVSAKDRQDGPAALGAHSLLVGELPHSWLLPRLDAAVHHGGAGTTGAVIRAGIPGLVLPVSNDQFFWGRRVAALGLGPEPVPFRRLTVPRLSAALERMINSRDMQLRAREIGEKVRLENGVQQAVEFIQAYGENRA